MTNFNSKTSFEEADHTSKSRTVIKAYNDRLASLKTARSLYAENDIARAVQFYEKYLSVLARYHQVEKENLSPSCFNREKDLTEMFLISHVYWDLAVAYDRHVDLVDKCVHSLEKFVVFTLNLKYHAVNFRMARKFVHSNKVFNKNKFHDALDHLKTNATTCYIANYCLGEVHPAVEILISFKKKLLLSKTGSFLVEWYYLISPRITAFAKHYPVIGYPLKYCTRPFLIVFAKVLQRII